MRAKRCALLAGAFALLIQACSAPQEKPVPALPIPAAGQLPDEVRMSWPGQRWWQAWHDEQLNHLVDATLADHPDLAAARARLAVAEAQAGLQKSRKGPELDASASVNHERFSANSYIPPPYGGKVYDDTLLGLNGQWDLDFWGKQQAHIEADLGEVRARQFEAVAVEQTLAAEVVRTYVLYQLDLQRQELIRKNSALIRQQTELRSSRAKAGLQASDEQIHTQVQLLGQNENAEQVESGLQLLRVRLQALTGIKAAALQLHPIVLPAPVSGLPQHAGLDLLARRADLAAARERVLVHWNQRHAAHQAFYPDIRLSALLGFSSLQIDRLVNSGSFVAGVQPALNLPLFDSGRLKQSYAVEDAGLQQAVAQYRSVLTQSIFEVQQALEAAQSAQHQIGTLQDELHRLTEAQQDAEVRFDAGLSDSEPVIEAQLAVLDLQNQTLNLRQQALGAHLDLIQALGGGFQDRRQALP